MDPYLEAHWGDVHTSLVTYARDQLQAKLPDDLVARAEEYLAVEVEDEEKPRSYYPDIRVSQEPGIGPAAEQSGAPPAGIAVADPVIVPLTDDPPTLHSLRIYDRGRRVITAIEMLSPANKIGLAGRKAYRRKQRDLIEGGVSLVEIDLCRDGDYVLYPPEWRLPADCRGPYRISVVRAGQTDQAEVYRASLRSPLPTIRVPLRQSDADVALDLQSLLAQCYENGRYARSIDYRLEPVPPLQDEDRTWANGLLTEKKLR
jgi:hypothetical protein